MKVKREHGRILSVETQLRGSTADEPASVSATTLIVQDAGDFNEKRGGTLAVGGKLVGDEWDYSSGQVVAYTKADDDTGVITLAKPLTVAVDSGDPVHAWSVIYDEPVEYQVALVQLDGDYDNEDPVEAEVGEGVDDLPEGDRGGPGESCTLRRISADEWEIVAVGGRSRRSRSVRFHQDSGVLATGGVQSFPLTYPPMSHSEHLYLNGVEYDEADGWSRDGRTITLSGDLVRVGDRVKVEYAYRKGFAANGAPQVIIPWDSAGWRYLPNIADEVDRSAADFDDSSWAIGAMPRAWNAGSSLKLWARKTFPAATQCILHIDVEDHANVYVNGVKVLALPFKGPGIAHDDRTIDYTIPESVLVRGTNMLAIEAIDDTASRTYLNIELQGVLL